jgi:very-short-patch-repair endonuclease
MIDVEIDGEQHYLDCRICKSDSERNEYLRNLGWTVIRIRWARYQRLSKIQK